MPLATRPTPLLLAPRLGAALGAELLVKRDDLTGLGLGGNKVRQLEFLLGDALSAGADVVVTGGGPGSNHVQLTAAAAARVGVGCHVVVYGRPPAPDAEPPNLRLVRRFGAEITFTGAAVRASVDPGIEGVCERLTADGHVPAPIPRGGATALGCVGYVDAGFELAEQLASAGVEPTHVFVATGSCGTQAGLLLGLRLAGLDCRVVGVTVSRDLSEAVERVGGLAQACADLLGVDASLGPDAVVVLDGYIGPGYGKASPEGDRVAALAARTEGLLLDPAFTAKAMAALRDEVGGGRVPGPAVFVHTGGSATVLETRAAM